MNRALFAGLSGTVAFQNRLDVVGNNIANANTVAYKEGRTTFEEALYETLGGGRSGSEAGIGGSNPVQIGSGVSLGTVQVQHTQGSLEPTGQPLDCAIEGEGLFVLGDGQGSFYSRDGSFSLDDTNTLVAGSSGMKVMGWMADASGAVNSTGPITDLSFNIGELAPPEPTGSALVRGNLDATAAVGDSIATTISIYDSLGEMHQVDLTFANTANVNEWQCDAACEGSTATGTMQFDASGALTAGGTLNLNVALTNGATSPQNVSLDLSSVTALTQAYSVVVDSQDGRPASSLVSVEMGDGGAVEGHYSDGRTRALAQVALASFTNPSGLLHAGSNIYTEAPASGAASIGAADTGGRGSVVARNLEMSNVDLTSSFVDMITTQRGFQASTRVISTANQMLDEVVRLIQ
ncbi:MAG: flagellar hook-basal body complex protein [Armatimonadia bacterium]|nr:flagellar hook-basal body complex protein [Armatimonadia bacterium]